ncbi:hypothetical protein ACIBQ1_38225 [Nonomuraea sp. NPDC050153]|uniref:hypothetical protein n=1 Tax=Nonomuraea sp. NPDC050153 TaxID=3364359 RepID=UPI0037B78EF5
MNSGIRTRSIRTGSVVLAAVLLLAACGPAGPPDPKLNLFGEYVKSPNVKNDRFTGGGTSEDRMANFAAYYTGEELQSRLLSAFPCTRGSDTSRAADHFDTSCDLSDKVRAAVQSTGGNASMIHGRVVLVKHPDGSLELLTLFVVNGKLIDATGRTYTGLNDFRANNDLLSSDDVILAPRNITAVPGEGEIVTLWGKE